MLKSIPFIWLFLVFAISAPLAAKPVLTKAVAAHVRPATALVPSTVGPANTLALRVDTPDGPLDLLLTPATQMQTQAAASVPAVRDGRTRLYQGHVAGKPTSWVRLSNIDDAWMGAIKVDGTVWLLDTARQHPKLAATLGLSDQDSLIFTMDNFQGLGLIDSGGLVPPLRAPTKVLAPTESMPNTPASAPYHLGVTLVLDTEFQSHYQALEMDPQSVAVGILNIADGFYLAQVDTHVYLHALESLDSNGPLTSTDSEELLNAFNAWVTESSIPFSGVAHLLSGKDFDGTTLGIAWMRTVCQRDMGVGVDQLTGSAALGGVLLAHEMGHNYGAQHDNTGDGIGNFCPPSVWIMSSGVDENLTEFSPCSLNYFDLFRADHDISCLAVPDKIFEDGFE